MEIVPVRTRKQLQQFISLPYVLYKNDANWVPPLRSEQKKLFVESKNVFLQKSPYEFFLAVNGGDCLGRAAVFVDRHFNEYWREQIGFFGSFECVENQQVASELLNACETWLREQTMTTIRGPINFESQNWGLICDDFSMPPRIMAAYNPPYYNDFMAAHGFSKVKDLQVFGVHAAAYEIPERFIRYKERLIQKYDLRIRPIRMDKMIEDVRIILDLNNRSVAGNWGVAPVSLDEAESIAKDLKNIVRPDLILIIEAKGEPIAFMIVLPEIYTILYDLNGRLLPFGIFKLMRRLKKINEFRFWALGLVPEFQRRGIDSLLYLSAYEILQKQNVYVEANYILEDNFAMKDAVLKLGMKKIRTYRVYEKSLAN